MEDLGTVGETTLFIAIRRIALIGACLVVAAPAAAQPPAPPAAAEAPSWKPMAYDTPGPDKVVSDPGGDRCTIFRPQTLGEGGRKHAIVLWGNGTGAQPVNYKEILQDLASWGFVVAAANTPNAGTGVDMLGCLD